MEFLNEREKDLNNGDFINEINKSEDDAENRSLEELEAGKFIELENS